MVRQEMESKARLVAASLSIEGSEVFIDNLVIIQNSLENFTHLPDVSQIFIIDDSGLIISANNLSRIGEMISDNPRFQSAVSKKRETIEYYVNNDGIDTLGIFEPLLLNGKITAWIHVDFSLKNMEDKFRTYFIQMVVLSVICTLIGVILTFAISEKISRVLNMLVTKFKKLASGDFTEKMTIASRDELEDVANSYNTLVDQISSMVMKLEMKQKKTEEELRESEEFFRALFENARYPIYVFSREFKFVDANPYACNYYGYSLEEFRQMTLWDLAPPGEISLHKDLFEKIMEKEGALINEIRQRKRNGQIVTSTVDNVTITRGGKRFCVSKITDITERKVAEEKLSHLANYDALTDLPNRILFMDRLTQGLYQAKRTGKTVAILFIDLDRFKSVNDTLGHQIGDRLLQAISKILISGRETDTVTRLGGDEFAVMLMNVSNRKDIETVVKKILNSLTLHPFKIEGHDIIVTASVGITLFPTDGEDIETLLKNADSAMYKAKKKGRNNFQFYSSNKVASSELQKKEMFE